MINKILSFILIIILSPLIILVMTFILFIDGTPIFFTQKRIGIDNQIFFIYKFRTMKNNLKDIPTHLISSGENLYTRSGPLLRKLSLDELPQLFNIFKGDMNFIGPRPALYNQEDLIEYRTQLGIHKIKPGLTGWAQINGRDDLSIEEKVLKDKYYIENYSLLLDLKILIKTVFKVVFGSGVLKP